MHPQYSFGRRIFPTSSLQPLLRSLVSTARFRRNEYFTYSCRWLWCFPPQKTARGKQCPSPLTWFFFPQKCKISLYLCKFFSPLRPFWRFLRLHVEHKTVLYTEDDYKRRTHLLISNSMGKTNFETIFVRFCQIKVCKYRIFDEC